MDLYLTRAIDSVMHTIQLTEVGMCPRCWENELIAMQKICTACYEAEEKQKRIDRIKASIVEELKKRGVRPKYLKCSFDNYISCEKMKPIIAEIASIDAGFVGSIFLTSKNSGTGKTHIAVALMRKFLEAGIENIRFISSPFLFLEIKHSYGGSAEGKETTERAIIERYCNYDVLIIDDIGVEKVSPWALQIWYMIIDRRDSDLKTTVYTSNLSAGDIATHLDSRIASRISAGLVYTFNCDDYRIIKRRRKS